MTWFSFCLLHKECVFSIEETHLQARLIHLWPQGLETSKQIAGAVTQRQQLV
jgi:hypothetical protein